MTTVNTSTIANGKPSTTNGQDFTVAFQPHFVAIQPQPVVNSTSYGHPTERTYTMTQSHLHTPDYIVIQDNTVLFRGSLAECHTAYPTTATVDIGHPTSRGLWLRLADI